jgi:hypothetical protein
VNIHGRCDTRAADLDIHTITHTDPRNSELF